MRKATFLWSKKRLSAFWKIFQTEGGCG